MFFTEEQKKSLKQAYATDPYPNQNTLEELSCNLGVATKTIINWFHNYRMRAKQQNNIQGQLNSFNCQNSTTSSEDKSDLFNYFSDDEKENADSEITVDDNDSPDTLFPKSNDFMQGRSSKGEFVDESIKQELTDDVLHSKISQVMCRNQMLNRRKSNKPQWLFEGTQLDKCSPGRQNKEENMDEKEDKICGDVVMTESK